ncbi:hypothetical protein F5Y06DRAFT_145937 [Hypoxylon sp. FL0890]|nr:hypothetical protein F5Y06DRAFT_145937 [Hypoxylon sp. FL0890]
MSASRTATTLGLRLTPHNAMSGRDAFYFFLIIILLPLYLFAQLLVDRPYWLYPRRQNPLCYAMRQNSFSPTPLDPILMVRSTMKRIAVSLSMKSAILSKRTFCISAKEATPTGNPGSTDTKAPLHDFNFSQVPNRYDTLQLISICHSAYLSTILRLFNDCRGLYRRSFTPGSFGNEILRSSQICGVRKNTARTNSVRIESYSTWNVHPGFIRW